jgi:hypothetical protein
VVPHNWKARQFIADKTDATEGSGTPDAIKSKRKREKKKAQLAEAEAEAARLRGEVATPRARHHQIQRQRQIQRQTHPRPGEDVGGRTVSRQRVILGTKTAGQLSRGGEPSKKR